LLGAHLIGDQHYVAPPWTHSKVEPYPKWRDERAWAQGSRARVPFRHDAAPALGNENDSRRRGRPAHDAVAEDRHDREQPERRRPPDERQCDSEQQMQ
jgi:hypothetical protein